MRLRTALDEYKRAGGERFPEERPTVSGAFSGHGGRLVHVDRDGSPRDHSYSLSGLHGIDRSGLGVVVGDRTRWFRDLETIRQHYYRDTGLVETEYDAGSFTVHQYDLTLGPTHATHVELRGTVPSEAALVAFVTLAPEGTDAGVGALVHETGGPDDSSVLEVYHRDEHDYLAASTGLDDVVGQRPERLAEVLADAPVEFPRQGVGEERTRTRLTGDFLVTAPLERSGRGRSTTLLSRLTDRDEEGREAALGALREQGTTLVDAEALRGAARERAATSVPASTPRADSVRADLRAATLLSAPSGGRIAAPEFDPFYANSGGYGYVWFRHQSATARHLLAAADSLELDLDDALVESARFLRGCQRADGTWPQRVWADDGSLAPGWANANVERDSASPERQTDQTAATTAFLATLLRERGDALPTDLVDAIRGTVTVAVDALLAAVEDDGLPGPCQNPWEDDVGRFAHTAAAFVDAFAAVARAPLGESVRERGRRGAERTLDGLDRLWDGELGAYVRGLSEGTPDRRLDASSLALARAFEGYDAIEGVSLGARRLDRLASHVRTTLDGLARDPDGSAVAGLCRYEDDDWRTAGQDGAKVWSTATGMGALAALRVAAVLDDHGRDGAPFRRRASDLYELLAPDGPLTTDAGYLAEQAFDDGTPDGAAPLGWSHAIRARLTGALADLSALPTAAAPGESPGEHPTWTTGEKYGLATAADHGADEPSRVWFTLTEGALTEARFPRVDVMNLRTLDFLVRCTEDTGYAARTHREDRRVEDTIERRVEPVDDGSLSFRHVFEETGDGRGHEWTLVVDYATDPAHDALVADVTFEAGDGREYALFPAADVRLADTAALDRGARHGEAGGYHLAARSPEAYTGEADAPPLVDEDGDAYSVALAMTAADRFDWASVEAGGSERLDALYGDGVVPEPVDARDGENVVLVGRLDTGTRVESTVALGFARRADTAAALGEADGALSRGFETVRREYADGWRDFLADKPLPDSVADDEALAAQYRTALMTLLAVEDKTVAGASIASPSVPWGEAVDATEPRGYGYNFVWSRDLYQVFTVFDAVGCPEIARNQLEYVYRYQQDDSGFIPQNTYVNGAIRWGGEQMDNISFPAVMAYHLAEAGYDFADVDYDYEHVARSADYVMRNGPDTAQERWEEENGYSPSSMAAEIAGLACAAELAVDAGHEADALVWLATADHWLHNVETWTATTTGTDRHTNTPYYPRIVVDGEPDAGALRRLANDGPTLDERDVIDAGFLELVRLGLVPATDGTVRNSVREVDETIRVEADSAPGFYRYNGDGYGEQARGDQGAPWSLEHRGKGRLWPLLTGERGEYELHLDDPDLDPADCLCAMQEFANSGRMLPEQVWDRDHGTDYGWRFGEGTGSATPLAWSMAQYVRLAHGIDAGEPVETPAVLEERYRERGLHQPDRGPALRVDTAFRGNELVVSGETTGERVAVKTDADSAVVDVADGAFEATLDIDPGENHVVVAAADGTDLRAAATTVWRMIL